MNFLKGSIMETTQFLAKSAKNFSRHVYAQKALTPSLKTEKTRRIQSTGQCVDLVGARIKTCCVLLCK